MRHWNSTRLFCIGLILLFALTPMSAKSDSVSDLLAQQQELTAKINTNRSTIETLQKDIETLDKNITNDQNSANEIARSVQVSNPTQSILTMVLSSKSISEFIEQMVAINLVTTSANQQMQKLRDSKENKSKALDEQKSAQVQLDQENQQLEKSLATAIPPATFTPQNTSLTNLNVSEDQARANIVARESGGNYQAANGIMYGAYQIANMTPGTSPVDQDTAAQNYVTARYGTWANAWAHWIQFHWY